jgi:hypothetical protein
MRGLRFPIVGMALLLGLTVGAHAANSNQASGGDIQFFPPSNLATGGCNSTTSLMFDGVNPAYCGNPPSTSTSSGNTVSFSDADGHTYTVPAFIMWQSSYAGDVASASFVPFSGAIVVGPNNTNPDMAARAAMGLPTSYVRYIFGAQSGNWVEYALPSGAGFADPMNHAVSPVGSGYPASIPVTVQ